MTWNPSQLVADRRNGETEERALTSVPWVSWDTGAPSPTVASQASVLRLAPVYAAARHITDTIATLPVHTFRRIDATRREPMGSLPQLLRLLDGAGDLVDWVSRALMSLVLRGNAVGLVTERDDRGFPTVIVWVPMDEIGVDDSAWPRVVWSWKGSRLDASEVVHIPWLTIPGRTLGLSPIEAMALSVDSGIGAQEFGAEWFRNGGIPPGTFKNTAKTVDDKAAAEVKSRLLSAIRTRAPIVYGSDWDFEAIIVPPEQAQFVETMKMTANQVAAIYGLDPTEVGGEAANSLTYSNEEHRQTSRLHNLRPWMVRVEGKISALLPERQYMRFSADAVIRADVKTRHEVYQLGRAMGLYSINELRALEDLPPIPGGDVFAPPTPPAAPPPPPDEETA